MNIHYGSVVKVLLVASAHTGDRRIISEENSESGDYNIGISSDRKRIKVFALIGRERFNGRNRSSKDPNSNDPNNNSVDY